MFNTENFDLAFISLNSAIALSILQVSYAKHEDKMPFESNNNRNDRSDGTTKMSHKTITQHEQAKMPSDKKGIRKHGPTTRHTPKSKNAVFFFLQFVNMAVLVNQA